MKKEGLIIINGCGYRYLMKVYDEPSRYGIDGGRISKLTITRYGETVCNYDREWDREPVDEDTAKALAILLYSEN